MMNYYFLPFLAQASDSTGDTAAGVAGLFFLFSLLAVGFFVWLLPGFIASVRKHHNQGAIWAVTILCGWTFVGWVIALVWAFTNPPPPPQFTINNC
jgi:T4 superinfection immunity protein